MPSIDTPGCRSLDLDELPSEYECTLPYLEVASQPLLDSK